MQHIVIGWYCACRAAHPARKQAPFGTHCGNSSVGLGDVDGSREVHTHLVASHLVHVRHQIQPSWEAYLVQHPNPVLHTDAVDRVVDHSPLVGLDVFLHRAQRSHDEMLSSLFSGLLDLVMRPSFTSSSNDVRALSCGDVLVSPALSVPAVFSFLKQGPLLTSSQRSQAFSAETKEHQSLRLLPPSKRNAHQGRQPPAPRLAAIALGLPGARPFRSSLQRCSCSDRLPPTLLKMEMTKLSQSERADDITSIQTRVAMSCSNLSTESTSALRRLRTASESGNLLWLIAFPTNSDRWPFPDWTIP